MVEHLAAARGYSEPNRSLPPSQVTWRRRGQVTGSGQGFTDAGRNLLQRIHAYANGDRRFLRPARGMRKRCSSEFLLVTVARGVSVRVADPFAVAGTVAFSLGAGWTQGR